MTDVTCCHCRTSSHKESSSLCLRRGVSRNRHAIHESAAFCFQSVFQLRRRLVESSLARLLHGLRQERTTLRATDDLSTAHDVVRIVDEVAVAGGIATTNLAAR